MFRAMKEQSSPNFGDISILAKKKQPIRISSAKDSSSDRQALIIFLSPKGQVH
jgi:hypothetical protein